MPYSSTSELPESVRDRYSGKCQRAFMHAFNSVYDETHDDGRASAAGHSAAQKCEGKKSMEDIDAAIAAGDAEVVPATEFKIYTGLLKAQRTDDGLMRLSGTASSTVRDLHGDTMLLSALEDMRQAAEKNLTIFLNHSYNVPEDVAGSSKAARLMRRGDGVDEIWDLDLDIEINSENPRAVETFRAIEKGTKLGLSIGAMVPDGGAIRDKQTGAFTIAHVDLLETSLVGLPANPRSWVQSAVKALKTRAQPATSVTTTVWTNGNGTSANSWTVQPDEIKEAPPAEPDVCGQRNDDESVACELEPQHDGQHSWQPPDEIVDAAPTPETEDGSDAVDGGSQGASPSEPDTEPASDDVLTDAVSPDVAYGMVVDLAKRLEEATGLVIDLRRQVAEAEQARDDAFRERDDVLRETFEVLAKASQVIETLADTPVGRKAVVRAARDDFAHLERIYGPALVKLMRGKDE